jgi:hypothetical protein
VPAGAREFGVDLDLDPHVQIVGAAEPVRRR